MTHHVVISKAGGATTQEAIAARCPMLVNQVVPGQEEGNYELLRRHDIGALVETPDATIAALQRAFADRGAGWSRWRAALAPLARPESSRAIAAHLLACAAARRGRSRRMKTRFILNPCAGRNRRSQRLGPAIREFIAAHRLDADLVFTERPGHASELARSALRAGCARVVAVGGDGTINEVAQALVGTAAALAIVPAGSGNGLALHLRLPTRPPLALALLTDATARVVAIDTGTANGHPFFNATGLGFDAEISRRVNRLTRRGLPAYARTGLAAFLRHRAQRVMVTDGNGRRETLDAYLVAVGNSDQYGNHARFAPGARVDDGLLDLVVVGPPGWFGAIPLVARLFLGSFDRSPRVRRLRSRALCHPPRRARPHPHRRRDAREPVRPWKSLIRPRSLRLLVPAACRADAPAPPTPLTMDKKHLRVRTVVISDVHLGTARLQGARGESFLAQHPLRKTHPQRRHHRRLAPPARRQLDQGSHPLHPHRAEETGEARHPDRLPPRQPRRRPGRVSAAGVRKPAGRRGPRARGRARALPGAPRRCVRHHHHEFRLSLPSR